MKAKQRQQVQYSIYIYLYDRDQCGYTVSEISAKQPSYLSKERQISIVNGYLACYCELNTSRSLEQHCLLWIFMPPKELWEAYSNRTVRPSVRQSVHQSVRPSVRPSRFRVRSISHILFEEGIPNLVCGYILGWRSVGYHFRVTVTLTLTSDLVFRIIVSGAYLLYYLR